VISTKLTIAVLPPGEPVGRAAQGIGEFLVDLEDRTVVPVNNPP